MGHVHLWSSVLVLLVYVTANFSVDLGQVRSVPVGSDLQVTLRISQDLSSYMPLALVSQFSSNETLTQCTVDSSLMIDGRRHSQVIWDAQVDDVTWNATVKRVIGQQWRERELFLYICLGGSNKVLARSSSAISITSEGFFVKVDRIHPFRSWREVELDWRVPSYVDSDCEVGLSQTIGRLSKPVFPSQGSTGQVKILCDYQINLPMFAYLTCPDLAERENLATVETKCVSTEEAD